MRSEFQINIRASRKSRKQSHKSIKKDPIIRQYLVLVEQIKQVLEEKPQRSMREIAKWLGYSPARLSQIFKLSLLAPSIKEELLLSNNKNISSLTISSVCKIANEPNWEKQKELWETTKS